MASTYKPWSDPSGIPGDYEPFRSPLVVAGQNMLSQPNWYGVSVGSITGDPAITYFVMSHEIVGSSDYVRIQVRTKIYTGPLSIRVTYIDYLGNMSLAANIELEINQTDVIVEWNELASWIVPGTNYSAMIWMNAGQDGARDGEAEFTALMPT